MPPQVATETNVGEEFLDDGVTPRNDVTELGPDPEETAFDQVLTEDDLTPRDEDSTALDAPGDVISDESTTPPVAAEPATSAVESTDRSRRSVRQRLRARQLRARKVRRTIRHIDPWSVLKFSVFFFALAWIVVIMAGVALWSLAVNSGLVTEVEDLVIELFDLTSFTIDANLLFRVSVLVGGTMALGGALFMGVLAVLFNLLSDLLGGIRVSVIEEETARRIVE